MQRCALDTHVGHDTAQNDALALELALQQVQQSGLGERAVAGFHHHVVLLLVHQRGKRRLQMRTLVVPVAYVSARRVKLCSAVCATLSVLSLGLHDAAVGGAHVGDGGGDGRI